MTDRSRAVAVLVTAALVVLGAPPMARAQASSLDAVDSLAARGETKEAREVLDRWWERSSRDASREAVQRALWLRGKVALDGEAAARAYRRLVVEYPGGAYTDGALLRLGLAARAREDETRADGYFRRLLRDHPRSDLRPRAERQLREMARAPAGGEIGEGAKEESSAPGRNAGRHAVQLGAFSSVSRAETVAERARDAGFEVRLVRVTGSPLVRVRTGRYSTEGAAEEARDAIRRRGLDAVVVANAHREEVIR